MTRSEVALLILSTILCVCLGFADATLCKPHSTFKFDCNTCNCSSSGLEFTCTKKICWPLIYKDKYLIEENEQGYKILKPKDNINTDNAKRLYNNNDLFAADSIKTDNKIRRGQRNIVPYPYELRNSRRYQNLDDDDYELNYHKDLVLDDNIVSSPINRGQRYILPHQRPIYTKFQQFTDYQADNNIDNEQQNEEQNEQQNEQNHDIKTDFMRYDKSVEESSEENEDYDYSNDQNLLDLDDEYYSDEDYDDDDDEDEDEQLSSWGRKP